MYGQKLLVLMGLPSIGGSTGKGFSYFILYQGKEAAAAAANGKINLEKKLASTGESHSEVTGLVQGSSQTVKVNICCNQWLHRGIVQFVLLLCTSLYLYIL